MKVSTLDSSDILVSGPNTYNQLATFVSVDIPDDGTPRVGTYRIPAPGGTWEHTDNGTYTVTLQPNQVSDTGNNDVPAGTLATFLVSIPDTTGEIHGTKWNDLDGDSVRDTGEPGLADWRIYLDKNNNGSWDGEATEPSRVTDSNGNYGFTGLPVGTYTVAEVLPTGWHQTFPVASGSTTLKSNMIGFGVGGTTIHSSMVRQSLPPDPVLLLPFEEPDLFDDYVVRGSKWPQPGGIGTTVSISYSYSNLLNGALPGGLTTLQLTAAIEEALALWGTYAPLEFAERLDSGPLPPDENEYQPDSHPDIRIGHHFIDGASGQNTLAHAYYPSGGSGLAGDLHFDNGNTWATTPGADIDLLEVALHELGHSLGLMHEPMPSDGGNDAIMNPFYGSRFSGLGTAYLLPDDIAGIQAVYGVRSTLPGTWTIHVDPGQTISDVNFGNYQDATISGIKFNDLNANGVKEQSESGLQGWTIQLDLNNDGSVDQTQVTDANGNYSFTGIAPGTHKLSEVLQSGWVQTYPTPVPPGTYIVTAQSGQNVTGKDFGNVPVTPQLPSLSINDVAMVEGDSGTKTFAFTVSMSGSNAAGATVSYATADGSATAGSDYVATSSTLTWAAGDTSARTINVTVNRDTTVEPDETFYVNLTTPTNATVSNSQGVGTIQNDDVAPPATAEIRVTGNGVVVVDGDTTPSSTDGTDFGSVAQGGAGPSRTFRVYNDGTAALSTSGFTYPGGFTITDPLAASIAAGTYDDLTVQLVTSNVGTFSGDINFTNNDGDGGDGVESPFNFSITGTVNSPPQLLSIGDRVWQDTNADGVQDAAEPGVAGAVVELFSSTDGTIGNADDFSRGQVITDASGQYTFSGLLDGVNYYLISRTPVGCTFTSQDAGSDDTRDSNANATGVTPIFTLTLSQNRTDLDAGLLGAAPGFGFAVRVGAANDDSGNSIATDVSANVYVTGQFQGTADFDPGAGVYNLTSAGAEDIFVAKYSPTGALVWARSMGGTLMDRGYGIAVAADGSVYTTGSFMGTADFDTANSYSDNRDILMSGSDQDIFVSKLDSAGNFVWAVSMVGGSTDQGAAIAVAADEYVYTTGLFEGTVDFDPGPGVYNLTSGGNGGSFVLKLDPAGTFVWARGTRALEGLGAVGADIALGADGSVYTVGIVWGTVDFDTGNSHPGDPDILTSSDEFDIAVSKLDSAGNFLWAHSMGGPTRDLGFRIAVGADGAVYTTGYFTGTADFDKGNSYPDNRDILTSAGGEDIFVSKLDTAGNFVWARRMGATGDEEGVGVAVADDAVYTTGYFAGTVDFDPGNDTFNLTSAGSDDIFVSKLDTAGNFVRARSMGGTSADHGLRTAVAGDGSVYTTGWFYATADFDPTPGTFNLTSAGTYDIFVSKLDKWLFNPTTFEGTPGDDAFAFSTDATYHYVTVTLSGQPTKNYTYLASEPVTLTFNGNGGNDKITMYDSPGADTFTASPGSASMVGPGYSAVAHGFSKQYGYGSFVYGQPGQGDRANLYDGPGNDTWIGYGPLNYSEITGPGGLYYVRAQGFDQQYGYETADAVGSGAQNVARFHDTPGDDVFNAKGDYSYLSGVSSQAWWFATGFQRVYAQKTAGGFDQAFFSHTTGNYKMTYNVRSYQGYAADIQPNGSNTFYNIASDFNEYEGVASIPGNTDEAFFRTTGGGDTLTFTPVPGTNFAIADLLGTTPPPASKPVHLYAYGFHSNTLLRDTTDTAFNTATLTGTSGNDTFVGTPNDSTFTLSTGPIARLTYWPQPTPRGFDKITVNASGGDDTATLTGASTGTNTFWGNLADAVLTDGTLDLTTGALTAPRSPFGYYFKLSGFDTLADSVTANAAGTDNRKHVVNPIDYALTFNGTWLDI